MKGLIDLLVAPCVATVCFFFRILQVFSSPRCDTLRPSPKASVSGLGYKGLGGGISDSEAELLHFKLVGIR